MLVCCLLLLSHWPAIANADFPDADDLMRLVQVRDLLAGQSWFDVTQYRVDAPGGGVPMHWSRLVDVPLALTILALKPFVGIAAAETATLIIVPLVTLAIAMLLATRIAWRLIGDEEATLTALVMALSVPVLFQLSPMRIDHHGWQIVCALAAVNGLMARSEKVGARVIGIALATWLTISIEGLLLAATIFAVLALRWLQHRNHRAMVVGAIQWFAIGITALHLLTRGPFDLASYCDAISPVYLAMFGWGALVLTVLSRLEPIPRTMVLAGMAVAAGGAIAAMFAIAPQCAVGGGFAELDPLVAQFWHANVLEGMPIWRQELGVALQQTVAPVIGLVAAVRLTIRSRDWLRQFWREYAIILLGAFVISLFVARAGAVACVLAAPPLAWQLQSWLRAIRTMERPVPRVAAMASVALALMPTLPLFVLTRAMPAEASPLEANSSAADAALSGCRLGEASTAIDAYAPGEVFAPLDISPEFLATHHSVVATGHHRGSDSLRFLIATSMASPSEAEKALKTRGTRYVALCPNLMETALYREAAPDGFVPQLSAGAEFGWLETLPVSDQSPVRLWRIAAR